MKPLTVFGVLLALTSVGVVAALLVVEPLSTDASVLYAIPPLVLGLYGVVSATWIRDLGLYGRVFGRLPSAVHVGLCAASFVLVGGAVVYLAKQPRAGTAAVVRALPVLSERCVGEPGDRLERDVLPTVERLLVLRETQPDSVVTALDAELGRLMERCVVQLRVAFSHPEGTHASWRRLRTWLEAHPDIAQVPAGDPLWSMPYRKRERARPPVRLDFMQ